MFTINYPPIKRECSKYGLHGFIGAVKTKLHIDGENVPTKCCKLGVGGKFSLRFFS